MPSNELLATLTLEFTHGTYHLFLLATKRKILLEENSSQKPGLLSTEFLLKKEPSHMPEHGTY